MRPLSRISSMLMGLLLVIAAGCSGPSQPAPSTNTPSQYEQDGRSTVTPSVTAPSTQTPLAGPPHPDSGRVLHVMSSGGFTAAYKILGPKFEEETGIRLETAYGASGGGAPDSIPERLKRGEYADVVILSQKGLQNLTEAGHVLAESHVDLARSMIGLAVRKGARQPDISSKEKFVEALYTARSIGYSASASGTYLSTILFPELGIWGDIEAKSIRIVSERVGAVVARGDVEIGFQQISEILPIEGIDYVGPIPDELQKVTVFSTGLTKDGNQTLGRKLIDYLSAEDKGGIIDATGLEAVAKDILPPDTPATDETQ